MNTYMQPQLTDPLGWVGQTIGGKYRVERVAGEGGFGVVYQAVDLSLQEPVALKVLRPQRAVNNLLAQRFLENLRTEAKILRRLSRATVGIVQAHAIEPVRFPSGEWSIYLVLEWLEGRSLADDLDARRRHGEAGRSLGEALSLLESAVHAIGLAHEQGVVHRDLKPDNLFLAHVEGRVIAKVLDFGVAKLMGEMAGMTPANAATGVALRAFTPAYGAPEQFEPVLGATGPWTDVYALALVLVETISGQPAYAGHTEAEIRSEAIDLGRRPSLSRVGMAAGGSVEGVLSRALAVDPRNRFPSAHEFWRELRGATKTLAPAALPRRGATEPSSAPAPRPVEFLQPLSATTTPVMVHPAGPDAIPLAPRQSARAFRSPFLMALGICALVAVLVGSLALGLRVLTAHAFQNPEGMVLIPDGQYLLGSPSGDVHKCEAPQQAAFVLGFYIDKTEVTLGEYTRCEKAGKCTSTKDHALEQKRWKGPELCNEMRAERGERVDDNPINCVDRGQAATYCAFVGKRLPTDEEWEAAARGTNGSEYPWGNSPPSCDKAIFGRPPGNACAGYGTARVASMPGSKTGVFDLAGDVWEWTSSTCAGAPVPGAPAPSSQAIPDPGPIRPAAPTNRQEAEIARLVRKMHELDDTIEPGPGTLRGGGFEWSADSLRSWKRLVFQANQGGVSTGFRCAKDAE